MQKKDKEDDEEKEDDVDDDKDGGGDDKKDDGNDGGDKLDKTFDDVFEREIVVYARGEGSSRSQARTAVCDGNETSLISRMTLILAWNLKRISLVTSSKPRNNPRNQIRSCRDRRC
ncbi:hypothetical protein L1987_14186 [Smallanthus sonchifolius]|uniref:Uncharacterized protein n=1 Tax=Smallanthus sonchifolius TaxID=185202 RepID=A0ACB9J496_9ASTR|nr:hypothetical protein L1987_14186 [Smallanthus sonchifolius]